MNPSGNILYALRGNLGSPTLTVIDTTTNAVGPPVAVEALDTRSIATSIDGATLYTTEAGSNSLSIRQGSDAALIASIVVGDNPVSVAVGPELPHNCPLSSPTRLPPGRVNG